MAIIGIDLGTTNSACGIWKDGSVQLIPNRLGELLTPSVVGLDSDGRVTVGRVAKERLISHSDFSVGVFKRLMGTQHKIKIGKKEFTAAELSSLVLRALKEDAEAFLGEPITDVVISVPAYFNDNQRQATKLAGELAGLRVRRLINEPTAAAMAYGLHEKQEGLFIILDMGGGTFDVSILEFFDGVMQVHASAGDNFLGGEDFVETMVNAILEANKLDRSKINPQQLHNFYMQLETIKRRIDSESPLPLAIQLGSQMVTCEITEEWFTQISMPLLMRVKRPIETALRDSNIAPNSISDVVLVGGATRMKLFRSAVARLFGRFPAHHMDPDLAIAMGAAIQAGLVAKDSALDDVVLTDVCPYSLGTEVNGPSGSGGGYFMPIIERNSIVPISISRTVVTAADDQTNVCVPIYQGENRHVEKNIYLGELNLKVPKGPAGKEALDIRYSYDMNGLLEVEVKVRSTGEVQTKIIEQAPGSLSEDDKKKSLKALSALKFHPREQEENRAILARGERLFESSLGERREHIARVMAEFDRVLDRQQPLEIQKARARMHELLGELDTEDWI